MSEANALTNQIIDYLYRQGGFPWRQGSGGVYDKKIGVYRTGSKKGVSDILCCFPPNGRLVAVEVKIGKDRLSLEQEGFLKNVAAVGGRTYVAKNFEEFKIWFDSGYMHLDLSP